jgi:hypothetical protein
MSDQAGRRISWGSLLPWHQEVIVSDAALERFLWDEIFEFGPRGTTDRIREARLAALENASDAFQTNRQGQGMSPVLKSMPRPMRSSMRLGKTARARRSL